MRRFLNLINWWLITWFIWIQNFSNNWRISVLLIFSHSRAMSVSRLVCLWWSVCLRQFPAIWLVDKVHAGYLTGLSLVRISLLSKPLPRPGWRQDTSVQRLMSRGWNKQKYNCSKQNVCTTNSMFWRHTEARFFCTSVQRLLNSSTIGPSIVHAPTVSMEMP